MARRAIVRSKRKGSDRTEVRVLRSPPRHVAGRKTREGTQRSPIAKALRHLGHHVVPSAKVYSRKDNRNALRLQGDA